jgi:hypothetical protein
MDFDRSAESIEEGRMATRRRASDFEALMGG